MTALLVTSPPTAPSATPPTAPPALGPTRRVAQIRDRSVPVTADLRHSRPNLRHSRTGARP